MAAFFVLFCAFAMATEPTTQPTITSEKVPVKEGFQKMDMNQFKSLDVKVKNQPNIKLSTNCRSKIGVQYAVGQDGFDACMLEANKDKATGVKNGATPSFNFSTGN